MWSGSARRLIHHTILLVVGSVVAFPNLGRPALTDDDEGKNAEAAREMREAGTWVVPTWNWELRTAKPVFLYWLERLSYDAFGVDEWSARLPSALMSLLTVLLTYELARRMFESRTALLAGVIQATAIQGCLLARAATPDSTLVAFTTLYFFLFWRGQVNNGRSWFVPCGVASGLAVLTKGPVGLLLPATVVAGFLIWHREVKRVWDRRLIGGCLIWVLVVGPWYGLVTAETQGKWTRAFLLEENLQRAAEPKENHRGWPIVTYFGYLCVLFAPWSSFLIATVRHAWNAATASREVSENQHETKRAARFLLLWIAVYFLAFSFAATKLPNYIAPLYPPLAILTAWLLIRWCDGLTVIPRIVMACGLVCVALTGTVVTLAMLVGGGVINIPAVKLTFPGLEDYAWIGVPPVVAATAMAWHWRRNQRPAMLVWLAVSAILFVSGLGTFPLMVIDRYYSPRPLVEESGARQLHRDIRIGAYHYPHPSLSFYVGRRVEPFLLPEAAASFLAMPHPSYLFVPEDVWADVLEPMVRVPHWPAARHFDYKRQSHVIVVSNEIPR